MIVDGDISGDAILAAQDIVLLSPVRDDLRAAGQHVRLTSPVSGHVVAAGQMVKVEQPIGEWAWLAGDTVEVLAKVGDDLKIRGRDVLIDSEIVGDVDIVGGELELGPNSIIHGNLRWRSNTVARISQDAEIYGELIEEPLPSFVEDLTSSQTYTLPLNTIVAVLALYLLFSRALRVHAERFETAPARSLLLGTALFFAIPPIAILLFFTGVGVLLGFTLLFMYFVLLILGMLTGLFAVSDLLLRKFYQQPLLWHSLGAIAVTVIAVSLLAKIPWIGVVLLAAILLTGIGALCWNFWAVLNGIGYGLNKEIPRPIEQA